MDAGDRRAVPPLGPKMTAIVVFSKECLPGRIKTRLHPALSLEQAAQLAAARLDDALAEPRAGAARGKLIRGIPMSREDIGDLQLNRLRNALKLRYESRNFRHPLSVLKHVNLAR